LEEPKLEPERIRSFKFCQSIKNSARQAGFIYTFYHATVRKCLTVGRPAQNCYFNLKSLIIVVNETMNSGFLGRLQNWCNSNVQMLEGQPKGTVGRFYRKPIIREWCAVCCKA